MSILNETGMPLDISLDQLGPLYYQNNVQPGETFFRETGEWCNVKFYYVSGMHLPQRIGAVHFTIVATYSIEGQTKNSDWSVAMPILTGALAGAFAVGTAVVAFPAAAFGLGAGSALVGTGVITAAVGICVRLMLTVKKVAEAVVISGGAAMAPGVVRTLIHQFGDKQGLSSMGWYAGYHHRLRVEGGVQHVEKKLENGDIEHKWTLLPITIEPM